MSIFKKKILNQRQLKMLGEHKYYAEDCSLLDPSLQPYWNFVVKLLPLWIAPNLITLTGLIINIVTTLFVMWYSPDCISKVPAWSHVFCAFGLFIYQTLDAIDGKQARRTETSSPLGELFDHGCDSLSSIFVVMSVCITLKLGEYPRFMFFFYFCGITAFYCSHWQTYVSGTFRFGKVDVTEAQITIITAHVITSIFGDQIWHLKFFDLVELRIIMCTAGIIGCAVMMYNVFGIILSGGSGKNGSTVAGTSVLSPGIPLLSVIVSGYVISQKSVTNMYEEHPVLFIITLGVVAAKVTNKLVVAHMTKSEMELLDSSMLGATALFLNQYFNCIIPEYIVLWIALIWALYDLLYYCCRVCIEICQYLHIRLFSISHTTNNTKAQFIPLNNSQNKSKIQSNGQKHRNKKS
ncbi:hypothetical protein PGB90_009432 [Kerria lacca]